MMDRGELVVRYRARRSYSRRTTEATCECSVFVKQNAERRVSTCLWLQRKNVSRNRKRFLSSGATGSATHNDGSVLHVHGHETLPQSDQRDSDPAAGTTDLQLGQKTCSCNRNTAFCGVLLRDRGINH